MPDIHGVLKGRMMLLRNENPSLIFEDDSMDTEMGTRAIIKVVDGDEVIALEFIEPEGVWREPEVVEEYIETAEEGIGVTVFVDGGERGDARMEIGQDVDIRVLSHDEIDSSLRYPL